MRVGAAGGSAAPTRSWVCRPLAVAAEHDLESAGLRRTPEHVVGLDELVEGEVMGDEAPGMDLVAGDELEQRGRGVRVDQARGDGHVLDPQFLEVQRGRLAVHADVRYPTARADQRGRELEGR